MLPLTPTKLGRYEIVDEIGKGAMGVVYLARDPLIGRLVALKTFRIGYSVKDQELEQFRIRFMREAQSAGILTHPNIVTIHDVVEASDEGLAFIAMEYVRGTNLKLLLQGDQPMSLPFAFDLISQVGGALDYAHANRVIHRDVKPANILITTDNRVKITDFGIARLESSNLTQEGQLLGTPNYMAPEQIQGKEVDHRADLFSLGIVLYEMLTRHKPFQGENLTVVSHRIVYDHFTPPRDYVRDLPPGVDRILSRALEKDPTRRYQRAKELVEDLRQIVEATTSIRGDDLNETQSLSSTMVLPPQDFVPPSPAAAAATATATAPTVPIAKPSFLSRLKGRPAGAPPPPPAADAAEGTGTGTGGTGGGSTVTPAPAAPAAAVPDLADTVSTEAPALVPPTRRPSSRRLLAVGAATLVAALLFWTAALLWTGWSQPAGKQRNAAEDENRARAMEWLRQGKMAQSNGSWAEAAFFYHKAEELQPQGKGIRRLRENAERNTNQALSEATLKERAITLEVNSATQALAAQSYDAAIAAALAALQIDPNHPTARAILVKAQEGKAQSRQRQATARTPRNQGEPMATTAPIPSAEAPQSRAPEPTQAETGTATLHVHFRTEASEGVLIVWVNDQEVWREPFGSPGGIFRFRRRAGSHDASKTLTVPAGGFRLRVQASQENKPAAVRPLSIGIPGGGSRNLEIHFSDSGQLSVN